MYELDFFIFAICAKQRFCDRVYQSTNGYIGNLFFGELLYRKSIILYMTQFLCQSIKQLLNWNNFAYNLVLSTSVSNVPKQKQIQKKRMSTRCNYGCIMFFFYIAKYEQFSILTTSNVGFVGVSSSNS